jgi:threonine synthase
MKNTSGPRRIECEREYSINAIHVREFCFGPSEVIYDSEEIKKHIGFREIDKGPNPWRRKKWKLLFESLPR